MVGVQESRDDDHDRSYGYGGHGHSGHAHADGEADSPFYWNDNVVIVSVGIDIGSSTSHLTFSRLRLQREILGLSSRFVVVERIGLWASDITLTPYTHDGEHIDADAVGSFIADSYARAGFDRHDVDTGVVILTGQALKRDNARSIADAVSARAGEFVCVAAGDHFEAVLSAFGSGSVELSRSSGRSVLCVDVGGGTTKLSLSREGRVVRTGALTIGARLVSWDVGSRTVRAVAEEIDTFRPADVRPTVGQIISADAETALAVAAADTILAVVTGRRDAVSPAAVIADSDFTDMDVADLITFSGGVSEYVFGRQDNEFGDLGRAIGQRLRDRIAGGIRAEVVVTDGGIRATVAGASQYSVQVSGNTVSTSNSAILPLQNVPVTHPQFKSGLASAEDVSAAVVHELNVHRHDLGRGVALSLRVGDVPTYQRLRALAEGTSTALDRFGLPPDTPIVVLFDKDVARSIGRILVTELRVRRPLVCLDNLALGDMDFVDVGQELLPAGVYPVVVKSLVFSPHRSVVAGQPPISRM